MAVTSFRDAYGVLQGHAETLRQQQEPNIDDLLKSSPSWSMPTKCARSDAVEKALAQALGHAESGIMPVFEERPFEKDDDEDLPF
jgi:exodeoxyribonuclease VII small subunit